MPSCACVKACLLPADVVVRFMWWLSVCWCRASMCVQLVHPLEVCGEELTAAHVMRVWSCVVVPVLLCVVCKLLN